MTPCPASNRPFVSLAARIVGPHAPFANKMVTFDLGPGTCVHLQGPSGVGKTTLSMALAGHVPPKGLSLQLSVDWDRDIPVSERCGVLFQQSVLLDDLTVAGNLHLALITAKPQSKDTSSEIKRLLELVGLSFVNDAHKRPTELSGGMGRRASLALQLAQKKHVIVLDEPFAGLDYEAAVSVAKELVHISRTEHVSYVLISHEPEIAKIVCDGCQHNQRIELIPKKATEGQDTYQSSYQHLLQGVSFVDRLVEHVVDYLFYTMPLILLAFIASGLAISMLSADSLRRIDITNQALEIIQREVKPLIKTLTGEDPSALTMMGVNMKVRGMLRETIPPAKAALYAVGMVKLFVLQIGPLLTALLLCGRIGGSYAGRVGILLASKQSALLETMGVNPVRWTLLPALVAGIVAAPVLTVMGTAVALWIGYVVGPTYYDIGSQADFRGKLVETILPKLRLDGLQTTFPTKYPLYDFAIEILTYPPFYHLFKSMLYVLLILGISQVCAMSTVGSRTTTGLTPRDVPTGITLAVVSSGLIIILVDGALSQLLLRRHP